MKLQKRTWVAALVSLLLLIACAVQGAVTTAFKGFIDFPCGYYYEEETRCIDQEYDLYPLEAGRNFHVFIDTAEVGYGGLGCYAESSETNGLVFEAGVLHLNLTKEGDRLYVDGKEWPVGESYQRIVYWNPNPWTIYRFEAVNYGHINICESDLPPQMIVKGRYGNEVSLLKAIAVLAAAIALTFALSQIGRRKVPMKHASPVR